LRFDLLLNQVSARNEIDANVWPWGAMGNEAIDVIEKSSRREWKHVEHCIVTALEPTQKWFLIQTRTDAERDLLVGDEMLLNEFMEVFRSRGCPDALVRDLAFTFESQETVDRDYAGNWYWALK
jgi:hypothetical protein